MDETMLLKPVANPAVALRVEFDDWAVLYNPDTGAALSVNPVGVAIWQLLDGAHSPAQIASALRTTFEDAPESVEDDVATFLAGLQRNGLLEA